MSGGVSMTNAMDLLGGLAVILLMLGVIAASVMAVVWWNDTWEAAVNPTRAHIYAALLRPSRSITRAIGSDSNGR
jgi:ABC-type transport system involved in cytochrome c biogenesis permease subunit